MQALLPPPGDLTNPSLDVQVRLTPGEAAKLASGGEVRLEVQHPSSPTLYRVVIFTL